MSVTIEIRPLEEKWIKKAREYVEKKADYACNGYDVFCECYSEEEWQNFMRDDEGNLDYKNWTEVKKMIDDVASVHSDRQWDAVNSRF